MDEVHRQRILLLADELRSGRPQTQGALRDRNGLCCLGIACDVYRRETGHGAWADPLPHGAIRFRLNGAYYTAFLPEEVAAWYGVKENPDLIYGADRVSATDANDNLGLTLAGIGVLFKETYLRDSP
jgi:hypothetical protein